MIKKLKLSKKSLSIIAGAVAAVVLGGILLLLNATQHKDPPDVSSGSSSGTEVIDHIELISREEGTVKNVKVSNGENEFTIAEVDDGKYHLSEIPDLPVLSNFLNYIWMDAYDLAAESEVTPEKTEPAEIDGEFGFTKAAATAIYEYTDDSQIKLTIGSEVPGRNGDYYFCRLGDDPRIFVINIHPAYFETIIYFCDYNLLDIPKDSEGIYMETELTNIELSGSKYPQTVRIEKNPDINDKASALYGYAFKITSPFTAGVDAKKYETLKYQLQIIIANKAVSLNPTKSDFDSYGISNPTAIVNYDFGSRKVKITAGRVEDSFIYIYFDGIDAIYRIEISACNSWVEGNADNFRTRTLFFTASETVKALTVTTSDKTSKFSITKILKSEAEDSPIYEYQPKYNGKSLNIENYVNYFTVIMATTALDFGKTAENNKAALTLYFEFFEEYKRAPEKIEFFPAGARRWLCVIDGVPSGAVSSSYVDKVIAATEKLINDEYIVV